MFQFCLIFLDVMELLLLTSPDLFSTGGIILSRRWTLRLPLQLTSGIR